jgi:hypothetical protein
MTTQVDCIAVSLLDNLKCDVDIIPISTTLSITRLDKLSDPKAQYIFGKEAIEFSNKVVNEPSSPNTHRLVLFQVGVGSFIQRPAELSNHTLYWHFLGEVPDPPYKHFDLKAASKSFRDMLTALRLLKPGFVGRYPTRIIGDPSVTVPGGFAISEPLEEPEYLSPYPHKLSNAYILEEYEIETLKLILKAVSKLTHTSLQIAVSRFNGQYTRSSAEDRLIDAVVALEAIYLAGVNDELKFRLAIRAATHLGGNDKSERSRIFELVTNAYDLRSTIVHGSIHEITASKIYKRGLWKKPDELLGDMTAILRTALKSILINIGEENFGTKFHKELDSCIITGADFPN